MALSSHTVKASASPKFHSLPKAPPRRFAHTVEVDKNAGPNYLKAWREFRKLSQEELGEKVGTTGSVISMLEAGERGLSAKWLRKLAPCLETTPGHLLDHDPRELPSDIIDIWMHADAGQRRQLSDVVRALVRTGTDN